MSEETKTAIEAPEEVTTTQDLETPDSYLAPESVEQEPSAQPEKEIQEAEPAFDPEAEQEISFGGKNFTVKGKDLLSVLENQQALAEKEKSLLRDYTQKTQALAKERKSFESAFGKMPRQEEIQALGKLYQTYMQDENVARVIDAIMSGQPLESVLGATPGKGQVNPETAALKQHILMLESKLSQFVSGTEREKQEAAEMQGKQVFDSWIESKTKEGVKIEESQIDSILKWARFFREENPSWDGQRALNEAYRHLNIDLIEKQATGKVFAKAQTAKKSPTIKITPKSVASSNANDGYAKIFQNAM